MRLENRVAMVAGGGSGIGAASVPRFAAEAARYPASDESSDVTATCLVVDGGIVEHVPGRKWRTE